MPTRAKLDADLKDLRLELIDAESCHSHRLVSEIRDEIRHVKETRKSEHYVPKPRTPE